MLGVPQLSALATVDPVANTSKVYFTGAAFQQKDGTNKTDDEWQTCSPTNEDIPAILSDVFLVDNGKELAEAISDRKC